MTAILERDIKDFDDIPVALRVMACAHHTVRLELSAQTALKLARRIEGAAPQVPKIVVVDRYGDTVLSEQAYLVAVFSVAALTLLEPAAAFIAGLF